MTTLEQIAIEGIRKSKVISLNAAAGMCDDKLNCQNHSDVGGICVSCIAMKDAADQIRERILKLL